LSRIITKAVKIVHKLFPSSHNLKLRLRIRSNKRNWIFGRVACMGQDVYKLLNSPLPMYNIQKGRVDYFLKVYEKNNTNTITLSTLNFVKRDDIKQLIKQQKYFSWKGMGLPKLIFMDSYSELTDQIFTNRKNKWSFCSNYSDLIISQDFDLQFEKGGLIPISEIENYYRNFFNLLVLKFPNTPILFLHFPIKLDKREKFIERHDFIYQSIENLKSEFSNLHSISIDESIVDWPEIKIKEVENFPYHYNALTYTAFADKIKNLNLF